MKLLYIAAGLAAVGGVILMFTLDSLVVGQLLVVAALLFVVTATHLNKK